MTTQRMCFLLQIKPERLDDYLAAHEEVWPDMLEALSAAGWTNYSLFVRRPDAMVVGYFETDDFERANAAILATDINRRWQEHMAPYFEAPPGVTPDRNQEFLTEYFHLA